MRDYFAPWVVFRRHTQTKERKEGGWALVSRLEAFWEQRGAVGNLLLFLPAAKPSGLRTVRVVFVLVAGGSCLSEHSIVV